MAAAQPFETTGMFVSMSIDDTKSGDDGGDLTLAAEYVLGTLDAVAHARFAARLEGAPALRAEVAFWQSHFSQLDDGFEDVRAPAGSFKAIERRLFGAAREANGLMALWRNLALWRGLAAMGLAIAVIGVGFGVMQLGTTIPRPATQLVATLQAAGSDVRYLALYDAASAQVRLTGLSGDPAPERDFELWIIKAGDAPVSMGVVAAHTQSSVPVPEALQALFAAGNVLAISLEPKGGSPTGAPTGPIVASGPVVLI